MLFYFKPVNVVSSFLKRKTQKKSPKVSHLKINKKHNMIRIENWAYSFAVITIITDIAWHFQF